MNGIKSKLNFSHWLTKDSSLALLKGVAWSSGFFALLLCLLMIVNFIQMRQVNPLDSPALQTLITHLEEDPGFVWDYLREIAHYVSHIHLADSTRRAPGTGHFDFRTFLNIFKDSGYDGFVTIETIMNPSFEEVAKESAEYLSSIL